MSGGLNKAEESNEKLKGGSMSDSYIAEDSVNQCNTSRRHPAQNSYTNVDICISENNISIIRICNEC